MDKRCVQRECAHANETQGAEDLTEHASGAMHSGALHIPARITFRPPSRPPPPPPSPPPGAATLTPSCAASPPIPPSARPRFCRPSHPPRDKGSAAHPTLRAAKVLPHPGPGVGRERGGCDWRRDAGRGLGCRCWERTLMPVLGEDSDAGAGRGLGSQKTRFCVG
jgi:hypothetical protein